MTEFSDIAEHLEAPDAEVHSITDAAPAPYNSLLTIFKTILDGAEAERQRPIAPAYAQRIVGRYSEINFGMLPAYHELYFDKLEELRQILLNEIESAGADVEVDDAEEDLALNSERYKNLLLQWQLLFQLWEMEWHPAMENAAIDLAATGEAFTVIFGQTGLTQFFNEIEFELEEADQLTMAEALFEAREGK